MPHIILDLDGTLCNCEHRVHHAQNKEWDEFHKALLEDAPNADVVFLMDCLPKWVDIVVVTGRNEAFRGLTLQWLVKHQLDSMIDVMLMRPNGDFRPDHQLKLEMLDEHFGSRSSWVSSTIMALDDRDKVVEAYRNAGAFTWQVRQGTY